MGLPPFLTGLTGKNAISYLFYIFYFSVAHIGKHRLDRLDPSGGPFLLAKNLTGPH